MVSINYLTIYHFEIKNYFGNSDDNYTKRNLDTDYEEKEKN